MGSALILLTDTPVGRHLLVLFCPSSFDFTFKNKFKEVLTHLSN